MIDDGRWRAAFVSAVLAGAACGIDDRDFPTADAASDVGSGGHGSDARADSIPIDSASRDVASDLASTDEAIDAAPFDVTSMLDAVEGGVVADGKPDSTSGAEADARLPPGTVLWARSASSLFVTGLAPSSTGIVTTGWITAPADLGGDLLVPVGSTDTVLAQFAPSDAAHQYSARFGGGGNVYGFLKIVDTNSAPVVHGLSYGTVDLGAGSVPGGGGTGADGFVGRYSPSGKPSWVKRLVGPGDDHFTSLANGPSFTTFVGGWYDATTVFDGTRTFTGAGYRDILLMQLDFGGAVLMAKTFATAGFEQVNSIAWTGTHLMVAGFFNPTTTIGPFTLNAVDYGIWAGKFLPDGTPVWVVGFSGPGKDHNPSMVIDAAGDMYVTGTFTGSIPFGTYNLTGTGGEIFVVKLRNSDGGVVWATSFGSAGDDSAADIALTPTGELIVAGTVAGPIQAGGPFAGGTDAAFVSYDTSGARRWVKIVGTSGTDYASVVTSGSNALYGGINLGGDIGTSVEGQTIVGAPKPLGLVLKFQP
jgi:hypothetical protein